MQSELRYDVVSESWESHVGLICFLMLELVLELEVVLVRLLLLYLMWAWLRQTVPATVPVTIRACLASLLFLQGLFEMLAILKSGRE